MSSVSPVRPSARRRLAIPVLVAAVLATTACSVPVSVPAPESAADPACSTVMLALPQEIDSLGKRVTTSQSTGAWGDPAAVVLSCGTPERGPSSDPCTTVDGVDWTAKENEDGGSWTLTAYGRVPRIEVTIDTSKVSSAAVAAALSPAVSLSPASKHCSAPAAG